MIGIFSATDQLGGKALDRPVRGAAVAAIVVAFGCTLSSHGCGARDPEAPPRSIGSGSAPPASAPPAATPSARQPAAATPALTVEQLIAAPDDDLPVEWDAAYARMVARYGPVTRIIGAQYIWAAVRGDECALRLIEYRHDRPSLVAVRLGLKPSAYHSLMGSDCFEIAGVSAPAGASAASTERAPPARSVTIGEIRRNSIPGRSGWSGRSIAVRGVLIEIDGMLVLWEEGTGLRNTIRCTFDVAPPRSMLDTEVTVTGVVEISDVLSGGRTPAPETSLQHCALGSGFKTR